MKRSVLLSLAAAECVALLGASSAATADDLEGAWATHASDCGRVFAQKRSRISFAKNSDLHGGGFIIDNKQIRGKLGTCTIKSTKQDGSTTHLIAACGTDIMFSDMQFSLKLVDHDKIVRMYPGVPELETNYERCNLK